jgi:hypothetical protein
VLFLGATTGIACAGPSEEPVDDGEQASVTQIVDPALVSAKRLHGLTFTIAKESPLLLKPMRGAFAAQPDLVTAEEGRDERKLLAAARVSGLGERVYCDLVNPLASEAIGVSADGTYYLSFAYLEKTPAGKPFVRFNLFESGATSSGPMTLRCATTSEWSEGAEKRGSEFCTSLTEHHVAELKDVVARRWNDQTKTSEPISCDAI